MEDSERRPPTMLTTDLSLRFDPIYGPISKRFLEHPDELADAFARAWFKLTHRDMGPIERYLGPEVPSEELIWQDPVPEVDHELIGAEDVAELKRQILDVRACPSRSWSRPPGRRRRRSAAATSAAAPTGRASGSSRRRTGRSTTPPSWRRCCSTLEGIQAGFGKPVSLADLIVLAGSAAVEQAAAERGRRRRGAVHAGPHRRDAGVDRRGLLRRARADRGRVPQLPRAASTACRPSTCWSTARTC